MMYLKCTDGKYCEAGECLNACRLSNRCAPKPFLSLVAEDRKWDGKPSVTQLIKGTREAYLLITQDKYVDPNDSTFRIVGVSSHNRMEADIERLEYNGITGMPDYFENGELIDYKVVGSYKIRQILGLEEDRATKKFTVNEDLVGDFDYDMQVNMYRIMLEKNGHKVTSQKLFLIARDGNTYMAKKNGVFNNFYFVDVKKIIDIPVMSYFENKKNALLSALESQKMPPMCSAAENWDGRKCQDYCIVSRYCEGNPFL